VARPPDRLLALTEKHEDEIVAAIAADFGTRPAQETRLAELFMVSAGIRHARRHLARWMRPRRVPTPLYLRPGRSRILRQPLGVVGVISPWNYPFQLALLPVVAALAAGNRALLKPSELAPQTAALLERIVAQHFARTSLRSSREPRSDRFAQLPFDHLFSPARPRSGGRSSWPRRQPDTGDAPSWAANRRRWSRRMPISTRSRRGSSRASSSTPVRPASRPTTCSRPRAESTRWSRRSARQWPRCA
jgi:hypothetical protein